VVTARPSIANKLCMEDGKQNPQAKESFADACNAERLTSNCYYFGWALRLVLGFILTGVN